MTITRILTIFWICCLSLVVQAQAKTPPSFDLTDFRHLAIQQGGRCKPVDTFAREAVRLVTGKEEFEKTNPVATVLYWWALGPEEAAKLKVVELRNLKLKAQMGVPADQRWFSVEELRANAPLTKLREEMMALPPGEKIPARFTDTQELLGKMRYFEMVAAGQAWTMVPSPRAIEDPWASWADAAPVDELKDLNTAVADLRVQTLSGDAGKFAAAVATLGAQVHKIGRYPEPAAMAREVHYNSFHPFRKAWMLYLFTVVCLFLAPAAHGSLYWLGVAGASFGFSLHAYGFFLRCMIAGRPPVTNMYESVIWVAFGAVLFALIFEHFYRTRHHLLSACAVAVIALILADTLPAVLDPSIRPLTPVLRSNYWLTIHVLTITLGYAAFFKSLGLGHTILWKHLMGPDQKEEIRGLNKALYKTLQVGVLLLAAGTILGGVWANYSWGRFWGWDPKEVWALIALLGYLAILHGRYAGWLGNFGTAAASVVAFQGVLMAWYGVNFVLGAGLHSYGFGNGGVQYVGAFSLLDLAFVALVVFRVRQRKARPA